MTLSNKAIEEFRAIYREDYGIDLEPIQAKRLALAFVVQMSAVYKPIPIDDFHNRTKNL